MYKDIGKDQVHQLTILLSLQLVQTAAMDGQPHIDKIALPVERNIKFVALLTNYHFAKVCRKPEHPYKPKPRVNNVDDSVSEAATVGTSATAAEQFNNIDRLLQRQGISDAQYDSDYDDYDDKCVATISIKKDTQEPVNW